ncbi:Nucleolar protein 12 [Lunasporangiospora selenospora]|uniref:Nucleolar protein 12 n=1 Tax=Lunasporangiospora selenospora TaxID=979761 RepID=A0A9P6FX52_9FUNG|nr:Nucleolar protein 12 [Lunasporangiospora selenospora]
MTLLVSLANTVLRCLFFLNYYDFQAGPSKISAPVASRTRKPHPEELTDQPKKKIKDPKPKTPHVPRKNKNALAKDEEGGDSDDDDDDVEGIDSVEDKYAAKQAAKVLGKATPAAQMATRELIAKQTKHEYGDEVDDEESKIEDLVHESLRSKVSKKDSKRKAEAESDNEDSDDENDNDEDTNGDAEPANKKVKTSATTSAPSKADGQKSSEKKKEDPERLARTVFVGNLAVASMAKAEFRKLKSAFSEFGPIESIRFRSIAFTDLLPRKVAFITGKLHPDRDIVNAYIVYKGKESVAKAVAGMNGVHFMNKHLRVDTVNGAKNHQPKKSVFVGNLSFEAHEEELWEFFKDSGDIENVRIIRDSKTNLGKGFAYVQFQDRASVDLALKLHETKMGTRKLRVLRCKRLEDGPKTDGTAPRAGAKSAKDQADGPRQQHAPILKSGAARRLAGKGRKPSADDKHLLKKKRAGMIIEGERSQKGAKVDLGIKKGKTKVKANVPQRKVVRNK